MRSITAFARGLRAAKRAISSRRQRTVTVVATLTIAVAVAAAVVVISFADAILFRPLPFPNSDRLVQIGLTPKHQYGRSLLASNVAQPLLTAWRRNTKTMTAVAGYAFDYPLLSSSQVPKQVIAIMVTERMFEMLGVRPALGTYLSADPASAGHECLLSDRMWSAQFGRDSGVVGRAVRLGEQPCRVVGVMPAGFRIPFSMPEEEKNDGEIWLRLGENSDQSVTVVGRLAPGVTPQMAERELDRIMETVGLHVLEGARGVDRTEVAQAVPMKRLIAAQVRRLVIILMIAAACLVLIACTNVSVALAAGVLARRTEFAVRSALGEGRHHAAFQLVLEALIVVAAGGVLGALAASRAIPILTSSFGQRLPDVGPIGVDARITLAIVILIALCGALSALAPVSRIIAIAPQHGLAAARGLGRTNSSRLEGGWLVAAQIALSLTLLSSMDVLTASFHNLADARAAYDARDLVVASVTVSGSAYSSELSRAALPRDLERALAALPNVEGVAVASGAPLWGGFRAGIRAAAAPDARPVTSHVWSVSPAYFGTMRMRVLRGQIPARDADTSQIVIDQSAAVALFGAAEPLGSRVRIGRQQEGTVMAVVNNVDEVLGGEEMTARHRVARPHVYVPLANGGFRSLRVLLRMRQLTPLDSSEIQAAISRLDPRLPAAKIQTMENRINVTFGRERFLAAVSTWIALVGFLIAMMGIYAVMTYSAAERLREFGLRVALGSRSLSLLMVAARPGIKSAGAGILAGVAISAGFLRLIQSVIFDVSPWDAQLFGGTAGLVIIGAMLSALIPASRALKTDPAIVMRGE